MVELSTLGATIKDAYDDETKAFTDAQFDKLAAIEASADVTDAANVTAAGALMDSELTDIAAVKAFQGFQVPLLNQTITDDTATSVDISAFISTVFAKVEITSNVAAIRGGFSARVDSSAQINNVNAVGVTLTTGALTGTTGADAAFTISAHTDGKLYFENRMGSNRNITVSVMG